MSLSFLSKKTWYVPDSMTDRHHHHIHTHANARTRDPSPLSPFTRNPTNLRNVEKVWIAEQKADAEAKKMAELKKQIAEERQLQVRAWCGSCMERALSKAPLILPSPPTLPPPTRDRS